MLNIFYFFFGETDSLQDADNDGGDKQIHQEFNQEVHAQNAEEQKVDDGILPVRPKSKRLLKEENQSQNEYPGVYNGSKDSRQKNPEKLLLRAVHT